MPSAPGVGSARWRGVGRTSAVQLAAPPQRARTPWRNQEEKSRRTTARWAILHWLLHAVSLLPVPSKALVGALWRAVGLLRVLRLPSLGLSAVVARVGHFVE